MFSHTVPVQVCFTYFHLFQVSYCIEYNAEIIQMTHHHITGNYTYVYKLCLYSYIICHFASIFLQFWCFAKFQLWCWDIWSVQQPGQRVLKNKHNQKTLSRITTSSIPHMILVQFSDVQRTGSWSHRLPQSVGLITLTVNLYHITSRHLWLSCCSTIEQIHLHASLW